MKPWGIWLVLLSMILMHAAQAVDAPRLKRQRVSVPIVLDGDRLDPIWVYPAEQDSEFLFEADALLALLADYLLEDKIDLLKRRVTPENTLSLRDVKELGMRARFDDALLEVTIEIPLSMHARKSIDVTGRRGASGAIQSNPWSGYLTAAGSQSVQGENESAAQLALVQRLGEIVFEGNGFYDDGADEAWRRGDFRLVHDDTRKLVRYAAGDLSYRAAGYQSFLPLIGFSVSRQFSIQPDYLVRLAGSGVIELQQSATVEILVNDRLASRSSLPRGRFDLRDLPLRYGLNEVKAKIIDNSGRTQIIDLSQPFDSEFLVPGISEFSYNLGLVRDDTTISGKAGASRAAGSLFHRWGISRSLNTGVNLQAAADQYLLGGDAFFLTDRGSARLDGALSHDEQGGWGAACRLRYRSFEKDVAGLPMLFQAEVEALEESFRPVGSGSVPAYSKRIETVVSTRLGEDTNFGLGAGYRSGLSSGGGHSFVTLNLTHRFSRNLSLYVNFGSGESVGAGRLFLVGLSWFDDKGKYASNTLYDIEAESLTASFQNNALRTYDDYSWGVNLASSAGVKSVDLQLEGLFQRGTMRLQSHADNGNRQSAVIGAAGSLVWGRDVFTLAKPISDAYVVLQPINLPDGARILVNEHENGAEAEIRPRVPAVISNTGSYQLRSINLDSTTLPMGYWLDHEHYRVQPGYRGGAFIPVVIEHRINVKGRLKSRTDENLAYVAGEISDEGERLVSSDFFTNSEGIFAMAALTPGKYRVKLTDPRWRPFDVVIPEGSEASVDVGSIIVEAYQ